jgi:ABC-type Mn2+/Zn2+ transport system permease subunit
MAAALGGLAASMRLDTPTGPTIVVAAMVALGLANLAARAARRG